MTTAVDTNVLLDILVGDEKFYRTSVSALQHASDEGRLVVSDVVYAELCCHFERQSTCDAFLNGSDIEVQSLTREAHFVASRAWREFRKRGGKRERILPDFLIASHAAIQAGRLLTRDTGVFKRLFPSLQVWDPSRA